MNEPTDKDFKLFLILEEMIKNQAEMIDILLVKIERLESFVFGNDSMDDGK